MDPAEARLYVYELHARWARGANYQSYSGHDCALSSTCISLDSSHAAVVFSKCGK